MRQQQVAMADGGKTRTPEETALANTWPVFHGDHQTKIHK